MLMPLVGAELAVLARVRGVSGVSVDADCFANSATRAKRG